MAKKTAAKEETLQVVVNFSGFVELPEGVTPQQRAEEIKEQLKVLNVQSLADKEDYKEARAMLTQLVTLRTTIEKVRKDKNAPITEAKKRIDDTAKQLTALFTDAEAAANKLVKTFEELEKAEKEKEARRNRERQQFVIDNQFPYDGENFTCKLNGEVLASITPRVISMSTDLEWEQCVNNIIMPNAEKVVKHLSEVAEKERLEREEFEKFKKMKEEKEAVSEASKNAEHPLTANEAYVEPMIVKEEVNISTTQTIPMAFSIPQPIYSREQVVEKMKRVLALFKAINPHGPAPLQLQTIIEKEIEAL